MQPSLIREANLGLLMRTVRRLGPRARVELSAETGISAATVTKIIAMLTDVHILRELPGLAGERRSGRPRIPIDFEVGSRAVGAVHVGNDSCLVAVVDLRSRVLESDEIPHRGRSAKAVIENAVRQLSTLGTGPGSSMQLVGIGVGSGGVVDYETGVMRSHPTLDWRDVPVRRLVGDLTGLPCEYDEAVRGLALHGQQDSSADRSLLLVHVGASVQCAVVIDGRLHRGDNGRAGVLDHWPVPGVEGPLCSCGRRTCFGRIANNDGLVRQAVDRGYLPADAGYDDLLTAAADGQTGPQDLLVRRAGWVGQMIAAAGELIDPSVVMISGSARLWPGFRTSAAAALDDTGGSIDSTHLQYLPEPLDVVSAAAALFLDVYFDDPVSFEPELKHRFDD